MNRSNSLLASVFVVLLTVGVTRGACTFTELEAFLSCVNPYPEHGKDVLGSEGQCNRAAIEDELCEEFSSFVECINEANVFSTTCRPSEITPIRDLLFGPCRVVDFVETCTEAPKINYVD